MSRIIAFGASNSSKSINHRLAAHAAAYFEEHELDVFRLTEYDLPIFSIDIEASDGFPDALVALRERLAMADALIISMAEHNGNMTAFFKNIVDWLTRIDKDCLKDKKVFLLSTSPGRRGGASAHATMAKSFGIFGAEVVAGFSLPSFNHNFSDTEGITDPELRESFETELRAFMVALEKPVES